MTHTISTEGFVLASNPEVEVKMFFHRNTGSDNDFEVGNRYYVDPYGNYFVEFNPIQFNVHIKYPPKGVVYVEDSNHGTGDATIISKSGREFEILISHFHVLGIEHSDDERRNKANPGNLIIGYNGDKSAVHYDVPPSIISDVHGVSRGTVTLRFFMLISPKYKAIESTLVKKEGDD